MPRLRTILAFVIAPLAIPVGMAALCVIFPGNSGDSLSAFFGLTLLFSLFALPSAYAFEILFGIPAWLLFCRYGFRSWGMFASGGIVLGTGYCLLFGMVAAIAKSRGYDIYAHSFARDWLNPMDFWFDIPAGLASSLLFRAIVFPSRSPRPPKPATA